MTGMMTHAKNTTMHTSSSRQAHTSEVRDGRCALFMLPSIAALLVRQWSEVPSPCACAAFWIPPRRCEEVKVYVVCC